MMKTISGILAIVLLALVSCKEKSTGSFTVKGDFEQINTAFSQFPQNFPGDSIQLALYEVPFGSDATPIKLDSTFVSRKDSSFSLKGMASTAGLYDILINEGPMIPLVNDQSEIALDINLNDKDKYYSVKGSPASEQLREFIFGYSERSNTANNAFKKLDSLKMYQSEDSSVIDATNMKNNSLKSVNEYVKEAINKANHPIVAAFILGTGASTLPEEEYEGALTNTISKYPSDASLNFLKNQLAERRNQQSQTQQQTSWVGKPAPDMTMPDPNGNPVSISSFKGKYVLVDFWASWCRPCREENPNVVRAYNTFKNRNFTVIGVSLDKEKDNWLQAIKKDNLTWTHMSDLAFWDSKSVEIFKFQGIPYNVLIDPNGIVIGESLRGSELMNTLQEKLGNAN